MASVQIWELSKLDHWHQLTLYGALGMRPSWPALTCSGGECTPLGFMDFTPRRDADPDRLEAPVDATRSHLPDPEVVDASACPLISSPGKEFPYHPN